MTRSPVGDALLRCGCGRPTARIAHPGQRSPASQPAASTTERSGSYPSETNWRGRRSSRQAQFLDGAQGGDRGGVMALRFAAPISTRPEPASRATCRRSHQVACSPSPVITGWDARAAGSPPSCTRPSSRAKAHVDRGHSGAARGLAAVRTGTGEGPRAPHRSGPATRPPQPGPRGQGVRLPQEPRLPAAPRDPPHHPGQGRPGAQPPEARLPRRPAAVLRPGRLPRAPGGRVWDQPAQETPCCRHTA